MRKICYSLLMLLLMAIVGCSGSKPQVKPLINLDLDQDVSRQVVVDKEQGQYLGHPTTVLLEDGKTILAVYPKGHGRGAILYKRSTDGGRTWSQRLPTPKTWETSLETPTIFRTQDPSGKKHLVLFSGLYPIRMAHSEDDGQTWTELEKIGDFGGIVAMSSLVHLKNGDYMAIFHDDGRFIRNENKASKFYVYKALSHDGGLTWTAPEVVVTHDSAQLCEAGAVRSPDGRTIALLMRENSRQFNSFITFSTDEGQTWSTPREMPASLTGDRHTAQYTRDGRLFVSFRDMAKDSPTKGDWVAWLGTWRDLVEGKEGQYRVRLKDNKNQWDSTYPGVEVLPDGTIVTTTYGHWAENEPPYIVSIRLKPTELDALARRR